MKNIWNPSRYQWSGLEGRCGRYLFVLAIFGVFIFYTTVMTSQEPSKKPQVSSGQSVDHRAWDLTIENPEKVFAGILQSRSGDWYRMGVSTKANHDARIDVFLYSVFSEDVLVGSLSVAASDDFQYHEIIFPIPSGMFSDVRLVLREEDSRGWVYTGVQLSKFALSRLNVKNKLEAARLAPTLTGNIEHDTKVLSINKQAAGRSNIFEGRFVAEADFIESIRLNAQGQSRHRSYTVELREAVKDETKPAGVPIKKIVFDPQELNASKDEWGNQLILFPVRLERGKEYLLMFTGTKGASRNPILSPLGGLPGVAHNDEDVVAIVLGRYVRAEDGVLLSGARVEDFGGEALYSYSLSGGVSDFFDLFHIEGDVTFDTKKGIIMGKQKRRTSFTYRFFTVYPFERLTLAARQAGGTGQEVELEYSYDNTLWWEALPVQTNESHLFSLALTGTGRERVIYVRASYSGEEKNTGSFGLDQLLVRAELIRK